MVKKAEMEGKALTTEAAPKGVAAKGARTKAGRERAASKARKPVKRREAPSVGDVREGPAALGLATSLAKRMRGLLLSRPDEGALLLLPCADVHTVGMGRRIDVAFVDGTGCVGRGACWRPIATWGLSGGFATGARRRWSSASRRARRLGSSRGIVWAWCP